MGDMFIPLAVSAGTLAELLPVVRDQFAEMVQQAGEANGVPPKEVRERLSFLNDSRLSIQKVIASLTWANSRDCVHTKRLALVVLMMLGYPKSHWPVTWANEEVKGTLAQSYRLLFRLVRNTLPKKKDGSSTPVRDMFITVHNIVEPHVREMPPMLEAIMLRAVSGDI